MQVGMLRLRPSVAVSEGRSLDDWTEILQKMVGTAPQYALDMTFFLELSENAFVDFLDDRDETDDPDDLIIVDADFDREADRSQQLADSILAGLISQRLVDSTRFAVFLDRLPNAGDKLFDLLDVPELLNRLVVIDHDGGHLGRCDNVDLQGLVSAVTPRHSWTLSSGLRRRRGVFSARDRGKSAYLYYYDVERDAQEPLQRLLQSYFSQEAFDVVVYDAETSGPWFSSCVKSAAFAVRSSTRPDLVSASIQELQNGANPLLPESVRANIVAVKSRVEDQGSKVLFMVPAVKTGDALLSMYHALGQRPLSGTRFLTVLIDTDCDLRIEPGDVSPGLAELPYGATALAVRFLACVDLKVLEANDWKLQAARILDEVEIPNLLGAAEESHPTPSTVGVWSLFEEYGADVERVVPLQRRRPKTYFPQLATLNEWDAHWLAEVLVSRILEITGGVRSALVIVMPKEDEENGSFPISNALEERCHVFVEAIPRSVIEGTKQLEGELRYVVRNSPNKVAIVDESTVTGGTLENLGQLVRSLRGTYPDVYGTVMNLGGRIALEKVDPSFALVEWMAMCES